jgi:dihydrofolate reductase
MRKIFLFMMVSLDGFFEGEGHDLSWHNVDAEFGDFAAAQLDEGDTLLFGWKTYELMAAFWTTDHAKQSDPRTAEKMNSMKKIVFSRKAASVGWQNVDLMKDAVREDVLKLKQQPGKDMIVLGSSNLCLSLIEMGLLDEVRIMINPVVIGNGTSLFKGLSKKLGLKLKKTRVFNSGNVLLSYDVVK